MVSIQSKLSTSGNSVAVRLPKELLQMSGLTGAVELQAKKGQIIIRSSRNPRAGWVQKIQAAAKPDDNFQDMRLAANDGLENLPWDGPSFEEWQKSNA